ncbi:MAG: hypothetical protein AAB969_00295 [Patescibacteria group bacterium]
MGKIIKEDCRCISINKLNEWGVLKNSFYNGSISWTSGYEGEKANVGYVLDLQERYFRLRYRIRSGGVEERTSINHSYPLTTTNCNYGGQRWWFVCSVYNNGRYCGRRVEKLYLGAGSSYFACRHCYDLSYKSRNQNRRGPFGFLGRSFGILEEIEELEKKVKMRYRGGRPTKKYLKLMKKVRTLNYCSQFVGKFLGSSH